MKKAAAKTLVLGAFFSFWVATKNQSFLTHFFSKKWGLSAFQGRGFASSWRENRRFLKKAAATTLVFGACFSF
ncbi:MAG: hypothetical protein Q4B50_02545 [Bacillota bacterium]|nr:hypothetical protein [Bacillota bacterium]